MNNQTVPVTNINGKRQLFEKLRGQFEGLIIVTQTYGDPRYIAIASMEALTDLRRYGRWRVGRDIAHGPDANTSEDVAMRNGIVS